jgi:hypothetical protein
MHNTTISNFPQETKMVVMQTDNDWTKAKMEVLPYGPMMFEPSATMINYGQSRERR